MYIEIVLNFLNIQDIWNFNVSVYRVTVLEVGINGRDK